jgi:hypothetical protein
LVHHDLDNPRGDRALGERMKQIADTGSYGFDRIPSCCGVKAGGTVTSALTGFTREKG